MSIERLSMLTPKGIDLTSVGYGTATGLSPADVSAALMDCTPLQQTILLSKSGCFYPSEQDLKSLHIRVCRMMVKHNWKVSKKDSRRKALLQLTRLCFHSYCSNQPITRSDQHKIMGVSRSQYHKRWLSRYNTVMDDFRDYLAQQEVIGVSKYYNRARS